MSICVVRVASVCRLNGDERHLSVFVRRMYNAKKFSKPTFWLLICVFVNYHINNIEKTTRAKKRVQFKGLITLKINKNCYMYFEPIYQWITFNKIQWVKFHLDGPSLPLIYYSANVSMSYSIIRQVRFCF